MPQARSTSPLVLWQQLSHACTHAGRRAANLQLLARSKQLSLPTTSHQLVKVPITWCRGTSVTPGWIYHTLRAPGARSTKKCRMLLLYNMILFKFRPSHRHPRCSLFSPYRFSVTRGTGTRSELFNTRTKTNVTNPVFL